MKAFHEFECLFGVDNDLTNTSERYWNDMSIDLFSIISFNEGSEPGLTTVELISGARWTLNVAYKDFKKIISKINTLNY